MSLPGVKKVYCLVRAKTLEDARSRVVSSLESRSLFNQGVLEKVVCLPSDFGQESLGLDASTLETIRSSLTTVIHSAWMVNFNVGLGSFERSHIAGVHNIIKLCLSVPFQKPAKFFFVSSISAAAGTPLPATIREAHIDDLHHAQNMGYARSKLVTENIIRAAAKRTGIHARVLRTGQLMGDSQNALWNPTEAIPLMIQSATTIGALPILDEVRLRTSVELLSHKPLTFVCRLLLGYQWTNVPRQSSNYPGSAPTQKTPHQKILKKSITY